MGNPLINLRYLSLASMILHLHFWGCSFFQSVSLPEPVLIEDNDHFSIRYEFSEKQIVGSVIPGAFTPDAYIFAVFHKGAMEAPIVQNMFFPGDTLKLIVAENHLNAAPEGNVAVLQPIGSDFQQEEISFSYTEEDIINLTPFTVHRVPYHYAKQRIHIKDALIDTVPLDSGHGVIPGLVNDLQIAKYPVRGSERNVMTSVDSLTILQIPEKTKNKLFVFSSPVDATLYIDGYLRGITPLGILDISSGIHTFTLMKEKYAPFIKTLDLQPCKSARIEFRMNPIYTLQFSTQDKGLKFVLDNQHEWTDQKIKLQLEQGKHILKIYKEDQFIEQLELNCIRNSRLKYHLTDVVAAVADTI